MSNLLKSKFLLGVVMLAVVALGAFALTTTVNAQQAVVSASDIQYAATVRSGSSGQASLIWQKFLNDYSTANLVADGKFGPLSAAQAKIWQAARGLVADGVLGAMSRAAAVAQINAGAPVGTYPAGCTSASGFSSTTGLPCSTVGTYPAGCTSTVGYSPTTGAKCDGAVTPVVTGGAGDIIVSNTSTDVETDVKEGDSNVKVLAFKVEADGSDISMNNVKVTLQNVTPGASSTRLERYVSDVSVWMGSTKVGSASADEFSKDSTLYSKNIALSDAVVKEGSANKKTFYVTVSALSNIDSVDLGADDWTMDVTETRFTDGTGVTMTDTTNITASSAINFISLATSGDVKITVSKGSNSPVAQNVEVSDTGSTSDVTMLEFKVKASGTDITFDEMDFTLDATGATPTEAASELLLKKGDVTLGTMEAFTTDGTYTIPLDEDLTIPAGETQTFKVVAKINKIGTATFVQGESLKVSLASTPFAGVHEDSNGDTVTSISGSALGEVQTFYSEGVNASDFTSSVVTTTSTTGATTKQTYSISYKLTAFGNTYYIPKDVVREARSGEEGLLYDVENSSGTAQTVASANVVASASSVTSTASTVGTYYEIPDGETKTFNVTIELTPGDTAAFYHVQLGSIVYDLNQATGGTDEAIYTFAPAQDYETADRSLPAA